MSCCKYRLDQSGRIENVPSESVLRVEARIDISPSGLWLKMLGRCPGTWSKRFPTRGKVLVHPYHEHWKPPIPRTLENHIITTKTTSQGATAEKWLADKVHWSQAFGQIDFVSHQVAWQKVTWGWANDGDVQMIWITAHTIFGTWVVSPKAH